MLDLGLEGNLLRQATFGLGLGGHLHGLQLLQLVRSGLANGHLLPLGVCLQRPLLGLLDTIQSALVHLGGKGDVVLQLLGRDPGRRLAERQQRLEDPVRVVEGRGSALVRRDLSIIATDEAVLLENLGAGLLHQVGRVEPQPVVARGDVQRLCDRLEGRTDLVALVLRLGKVEK